MNRLKRIVAPCLALMLLVIVGCTSNASPKEALQKAIVHTSEADSYAMNMTFTLEELELAPSGALAKKLGGYTGFLGMLKNATITMDAVYQKDPMRTDVMLEIVTSGLIEFKIIVPMIITEQNAYIRMPEVPMFPLPESITGKYVKIDLNEIAADNEAGSMDAAQQLKVGHELVAIMLKSFDDKPYFSELKAADAGLPDGMKADRIVKFQAGEGNAEQTVDTIVSKVLPELATLLLSNDATLKLLKLERQEVEDLRAKLETNRDELKSKLMSSVKINELTATGAIKDKYLVHNDMKINVEWTDEATSELTKLAFHMKIAYSDLNKAPKFEEELPEDTITMKQMLQLLQFPIDM